MKYRTIALGFALAFSASIALAQVDPATGTVTNDATMARLRVNNCVWRSPRVDVFLNGEIAVNGGVPQTDRGFYTFGYLYLTPGTHSIAVVPTGQGIDQALLHPVDVQVAAGHRYTLVVMGQADEQNHEALVIDETEAYQAIGGTPTTTPHLTINNIVGPAGISFILDGAVREDNVPFGGFQVALWPTGWSTGPGGLDLRARQ